MHPKGRSTLLKHFLSVVIYICTLAGFAQNTSSAKLEERMFFLYDAIEEQLLLNADSAYSLSKEYIRLSHISGDSLEIALAYDFTGVSAYYRNDLDSAAYFSKKALAYYTALNDSTNIAGVYIMLGNIYADKGDYIEGVDYYQQSMELNELLGDKESVAISLLNISYILLEQGNLKLSEEYLNRSYTIMVENKFTSAIANVYNGFSEIYIKRNLLDSALYFHNKAARIARSENDLLELSTSYNLRGNIECHLGNYKEAENYINEAIRMAKEYGDGYSVALFHQSMASVFLKSDRIKRGLQTALKAHSLAKIEGSLYLLRESVSILSRAYELNENYSMALEYYKVYSVHNKALLSHNVQEKMLEQESAFRKKQYELVSKQNQLKAQVIERTNWVMAGFVVLMVVGISLIVVLYRNNKRKKLFNDKLQAKNMDIERQQQEIDKQSKVLQNNNIELERLNETKDKLFSILSHDLKQPFHQIISLIEVAQTSNDLDSEEFIMLLDSVKDSARHTQGAVENLLIWSKAQFTGIKVNPVKVNLETLINDIEKQCSAIISAKKLRLQSENSNFPFCYADEIQVEIVLRNLIVNAVKFSSEGGIIEIKTKEEFEMICISIKDYGVGMTEKQLSRLQDFSENLSTPGTMNEKGTGLGVLIVQDFVKANGGHLKVQSEKGNGSIFSVYLPLWKE